MGLKSPASRWVFYTFSSLIDCSARAWARIDYVLAFQITFLLESFYCLQPSWFSNWGLRLLLLSLRASWGLVWFSFSLLCSGTVRSVVSTPSQVEMIVARAENVVGGWTVSLGRPSLCRAMWWAPLPNIPDTLILWHGCAYLQMRTLGPSNEDIFTVTKLGSSRDWAMPPVIPTTTPVFSKNQPHNQIHWNTQFFIAWDKLQAKEPYFLPGIFNVTSGYNLCLFCLNFAGCSSLHPRFTVHLNVVLSSPRFPVWIFPLTSNSV